MSPYINSDEKDMLKAASTVRSPSVIPTTPRPTVIAALKTLDPRLVPQIPEDDQTMSMPGASVHRQKGDP